MFEFEDDELAYEFLGTLRDRVELYGSVTLGEAKDIMGLGGSWIDYNKGWIKSEILEATVVESFGGYYIDLYEPQVL